MERAGVGGGAGWGGGEGVEGSGGLAYMKIKKLKSFLISRLRFLNPGGVQLWTRLNS